MWTSPSVFAPLRPAKEPISRLSMTTSAHASTDGRLSAFHVACLAAAAVACRALATHAVPIYDDAFITWRYARNLAEGSGLVFNPGASWEPILGTTTPLYALVLAGLAKLGAAIPTASLALNFACDAASAFLLAQLVGRRITATLVTLIAFAALPHVVRISAGGMESPLFALCALSAAVLLDRGRPALAGVAAGLTCLVRPEGVLLAGLLFLSRARRPRELVRFTLPVLAIGVISVALLTHFYGTPIPQSVAAKSTMHGKEAFLASFGRWRTILAESFAPHLVLLPLVPLVLWGAVRALREGGSARLFSLFPLAIVASYLAARPHTWGWYYYVPLVGWCAWLGLGAEAALARFLPKLTLRPVLAPIAAIAAVGATAFVAHRFPTTVPERVYAPMHAWAELTSRAEPSARILASDIGAIGWTWNGTVLDSEGLVWPEALRHGSPNAIIEACAPEYLLVVAERPRVASLRGRSDLDALYEPIARFAPDGASELAPSTESLPPQWKQDYLLYKRRPPR